MPTGLPVANLINISATLTGVGATYANLSTKLIIGDSDVIDTFERLRQYANLTAVAGDFGMTAPEYLAAEVFFDQTPTPTSLYIGRWAKTATSGVLQSGILNANEQAITNWSSITNGSFGVTIDGSPFTIAGLVFTGATNLNGIASTIATALNTAGVTPPAAPVLSAITGGALASFTYYAKTTYVTANGESVPSTEASLLVAANKVLGVASPASAGQYVTGYNVYVSTTTGTETKQNTTPIAIGTAWQMPNTGIIAGTAIPSTNTATILGSVNAGFVWNGTEDNFTLTSGSTGVSSSVSFLTNAGIGTDISSQLLGTSTTSQYASSGIAAESALAAVVAMSELTTYWYGLSFASGLNNADIADSDYLAIAPFIEAGSANTGNAHMFGITTSETGALVASTTTDIGSELQAAQYTRTFVMYSSENAYACCALFGLLLTINFQAEDSMLAVMWKTIAGVTTEVLSATSAASLNAKNYSYFALFNNGVSIVVNGTMASGDFLDEIYGLDGFVNQIQTDIFNLFSTTKTKIPQTDDGMHQITTTVQGSCAVFVNNGYLAPGTWSAAGVGPVTTGQTLSTGYYVWAAPMSLQTAAQRGSRVGQTVEILAIEAGAIQTLQVSLTVNR